MTQPHSARRDPSMLARPRHLRSAVALTMLGLVASVAGCGGEAPVDMGGPVHAQMHVHDAASDDSLFDQTAARTFPVTLGDLSVSPAMLRGTRNSLIEIDLQNVGALDHDFTISKIDVDQATRQDGVMPAGHEHTGQYAVHVALGAKQSARLRLHLHQPGTYTFFCTVTGHEKAGMRGVLVVE